MPSISFQPKVRSNLEAVLQSFERCADSYPPLFHQRLIPWSQDGEAPISRLQWEAFVEAQSDFVGHLPWYEWDGPNHRYLGMWHGQRDGLDVFVNLIESLAIVFRSSEPPIIDGLAIEFHKLDWCEWLPLLHDWAFRFQMPLLRSDMSLWMAEEGSFDDFYTLAERWQTNSTAQFPVHPVVWRLVDDVFTCSITALRAMLEPGNVIATNNPWEHEESQPKTVSEQSEPDRHALPETACHRLVFSRTGWGVQFADSDLPFFFGQQAGLIRMAQLIDDSPRTYSAEDLYKHGARKFTTTRTFRRRSSYDGGLSEQSGLDIEQEKDTEEARLDVQKRLQELSEERRVAEANDDLAMMDRIDEEVAAIETYHNVEGSEVKRQRAFAKKQKQNEYKAVKKSIEEALDAIASEREDVAAELGEQIERKGIFAFAPNPEHTPWRVERR